MLEICIHLYSYKFFINYSKVFIKLIMNQAIFEILSLIYIGFFIFSARSFKTNCVRDSGVTQNHRSPCQVKFVPLLILWYNIIMCSSVQTFSVNSHLLNIYGFVTLHSLFCFSNRAAGKCFKNCQGQSSNIKVYVGVNSGVGLPRINALST